LKRRRGRGHQQRPGRRDREKTQTGIETDQQPALEAGTEKSRQGENPDRD